MPVSRTNPSPVPFLPPVLRLVAGLLVLTLGLGCSRPAPDPGLTHQPSPGQRSAALKAVTLEEQVLYDKVLGALVGSAIGDAMGAPTEMWGRREMQATYGHIDRLDAMVREPSPEGTWDWNLPAGGTTDDTRWKGLMVDFFTGAEAQPQPRPVQLSGQAFAQHLMTRYEQGIADLRRLPAQEVDPYETALQRILWLKEWAKVARPYAAGDWAAYHDSLSRFYGGEMVCAGMLFAPLVGVLYGGDPAQAYQQTWEIDIFDLGHARDISGLTAALTAAALTTDSLPVPDSLFAVLRQVDPQGYFRSRLVGRTAYHLYREARQIAFEARQADPARILANPPVRLALPLRSAADSLRYAQWSVAYAALDARLERLPFHPAEIWLVSLTAMLLCDLDFGSSLSFIVNFGRDNDTSAAVAGAILGALHGAKGLPQDLLQQALDANRPLGQDLPYQAARLVQAMR